jgi:hypothetical protein
MKEFRARKPIKSQIYICESGKIQQNSKNQKVSIKAVKMVYVNAYWFYVVYWKPLNTIHLLTDMQADGPAGRQTDEKTDQKTDRQTEFLRVSDYMNNLLCQLNVKVYQSSYQLPAFMRLFYLISNLFWKWIVLA